MALHSSWKGYLKLSLVSVPVKAFSAISAQEGEIHFNQLHDKCHRRIKYVKTCPVHGEVDASEIVSGYEFAKGEFVVIDKSELDQLLGESEKSVNVEAIVPQTAIDPLYLSESSTYLVPDGRVAQKPYALMERCLSEQKSIIVGRRILKGKDEVVAIRPFSGILLMTVLNTAAQVRTPDVFGEDVEKVSVSAAEVKLTKTLFDAYRQEKIDLSEYSNGYAGRVAALVEAKIKGKTAVKPTKEEQPHIINLMDALKKSVASAKASKSSSKKVKTSSPRATSSHTKPAAKQKSRTA